MARDGSFVEGEFYGPPSYGQWEECYDVLATALLMLGIVGRNKIADYKQHIRELAAAYGPKVWHLLYQTDVRCRQELMHELHHDALSDHNEAAITGEHSRFTPNKPWDFVWSMVLDDKHSKWWTREFERPAQLVLTHIASLDSMLGGDVGISSTRMAGTMDPSRAAQRAPPPPRAAPHGPAKPTGARQTHAKPTKGHQRLNPDGTMATNRSGAPLCGGFQAGTCSSVGKSNSCPHTDSVHQCSVCLSGEHGARHPSQCTKPQKTATKSKGGGKGRKGK